jgi:Ferritin-like
MERLDAAGFVPGAPPELGEPSEAMPRVQDFSTVGHLYRGIMHGLSHLADRIGEHALFVGSARTQATPEVFRWPQLVTVTDLESAHAAIEEIIEQGEGARGDWGRRITAGSCASGTSTASSASRTLFRPGPARDRGVHPSALRYRRAAAAADRAGHAHPSPSCSTSDKRRCCGC